MGCSTIIWIFQAKNKRTLTREILEMAKKKKKGKIKKEIESLLIAAQNNAIRTNRVKEKIDKT